MQYKPIITKTAIIFHLQKPIYDSHFGIWDRWIKIAKKDKLKMIVYTPFGLSTYPTYKQWMKEAVKKNRFYKNPNEPMVFWCRDLLPDIRLRRERKEREARENTISSDEYAKHKRRMLEIAKKIGIIK